MARRMFQAKCTVCGRSCEVPFEPQPGRPIYCNEHFGKRGDAAPSSHRMERGGDAKTGSLEKRLHAIEAKLDQLILQTGSAKRVEGKGSSSEPAPQKVVAKSTTKKAAKKVSKKKTKK